MTDFQFDLEEDSPDEPAVGLIVLQTDETMEHELRHWLPSRVRLFHSRIPNSVDINSDSLQAMKQVLPATAALLPSTTAFAVIAYGCTSAATVIGEQAVTDAVQSVFPEVAVTNPLSAIKAQLASLNARRIALLSPYVPAVSRALVASLEKDGYQVAQIGSFNESRDDRVARIASRSLMHALEALASENDVDAIVASCTNLRMSGLVQEASAQIGIPVISSNSALAWHIQVLLSDRPH